MKKLSFIFILLAFVLCSCETVYYAAPNNNRYRNYHSGGPSLIPPLRKDILEPRRGGVSKSPNAAMANAVAISGFAAMGARMAEEFLTPDPGLVLVIPEGTTTPIVIREQEPVVKDPVPISPLPMELMKSH